MLIYFIVLLNINVALAADSVYLGECNNPKRSWDCTGINTYRICSHGRLIGEELYCPGNTICNISYTKICHEPNYRVQMTINQKNTQMQFRQMLPDRQKKPKKKIPYCLTKINYELYTRLCKVEIMKLSKFLVFGTGCKTFVDCGQSGAAFECPEGTFFNGKACTEDYVCPEPCEPVPEQLKLKNVIAKGEIKVNSSEGRYPVMGSGCKFFVEWSVDKYGNLHGVLDQCPEMSWFDPRENICKMRYFCPEFVGDEKAPKRCEEGIDHDICDPELHEPICRTYGSIPIDRSGCHFFAACETNKKKLKRCPENTLFNPTTTSCETGHECDQPCRPYSPKIFENPFYQLKCYFKNGLRPLIGTNCKYFLKCINWIASVRKCPDNGNFDPKENTCSHTYKCNENCVPRERFPIEYDEDYEEENNNEDINQNDQVPTKIQDETPPPPDYMLRSNLYSSNNSSTENKDLDNTGLIKSTNPSKTNNASKNKQPFKITTEQQLVQNTKEIEACYADIPKEPKCEFAGKIAVPHTACTGYIICLEITDNNYRRVEMFCPKGKKFNPTKQECNSKYVCHESPKCQRTLILYMKKMEDNQWALPCESGEKINVPKCVIPGVFTLDGTGCKKFYYCYSEGELLLQRIFICPDGMYFNPNFKSCDPYFHCQSADKCAVGTSSTKTSVVVINQRFVCPENKATLQVPNCVNDGLFEFPMTGCRKYYRCSLKENQFTQTVEFCPEDQFFDPRSKKCLSSYVCLQEDKCGFDHTYIMKYKPNLEMDFVRKK